MKRLRFRKTPRESVESAARGDRHYAALAGVAPRAQERLESLPAKRVITNHSDESELESAVLREVGQLLAVHPAIVFAVRQNGGMVQTGNGTPVWFYRVVRAPQPMVLTDYWGFVKTDSGTRPLILECKRRGWKLSEHNPSAREMEQYALICLARSMGGRGGFVTSAAEAQKLIEGRG